MLQSGLKLHYYFINSTIFADCEYLLELATSLIGQTAFISRSFAHTIANIVTNVDAQSQLPLISTIKLSSLTKIYYYLSETTTRLDKSNSDYKIH